MMEKPEAQPWHLFADAFPSAPASLTKLSGSCCHAAAKVRIVRAAVQRAAGAYAVCVAQSENLDDLSETFRTLCSAHERLIVTLDDTECDCAAT